MSTIGLRLLKLWFLKTTLKGKKRGVMIKIWMSDDGKYVIWSDESSFMLFPTSGWTPMEAYNPECHFRIMKHGHRSVVVWVAISWYSAVPLIALRGQITASDRMHILGNQVHPMFWMFPNDALFQDGSSPILTARKCSVLVWRAWRCTSTSSLASTIDRLEYHRTTLFSFGE